MKKVVFIEFISTRGAKYYFAGASKAYILADTQGGTRLAGVPLASHREITEKEARELKLGYLDEAIKDVKKYSCKSFRLSTPR